MDQHKEFTPQTFKVAVKVAVNELAKTKGQEWAELVGEAVELRLTVGLLQELLKDVPREKQRILTQRLAVNLFKKIAVEGDASKTGERLADVMVDAEAMENVVYAQFGY